MLDSNDLKLIEGIMTRSLAPIKSDIAELKTDTAQLKTEIGRGQGRHNPAGDRSA